MYTFTQQIHTHAYSQFGTDQVKWTEKYGGIYKSYWLFNRLRVNVTDGKILQKILVNEAYNFVKPKGFLGLQRQVLGAGLLLAEGEVHKKQRKLMNPSFNHNCIKVIIMKNNNINSFFFKRP